MRALTSCIAAAPDPSLHRCGSIGAGSNVAALWHREKGVCDMPQLVPVVAEHQRVRRARQYDELAVRVWQLPIKIEQILFAGDPVMLAAHDHDRRRDLE